MGLRFEKFLALLNLTVIKSSLEAEAALDAVAAVYNPNVQAHINLDVDVPVELKVKDYYLFLVHKGPRPFWFETGEQTGK